MSKSGKRLTMIFTLAVMTFCASGQTAWGEDNPVITISAHSRFFDKEEVNAMPGQIDLTETQTRLKFEDKYKDELPIEASLMVRHIDIDEDLAVELPTHLEARRIGIGTKFPAPFIDSDEFFMGVDFFPSLYTDDWEWEDSAFRMPVWTYLIYKPDEDLIFVFGLAVRIDYDTPVLPLVGMIYRPNDRLSFNLASADPNISYKVDEKLTVFCEFDYAFDEYEVSRGADRGVVLKYRQLSTGWGFNYALNDAVDASLSAGAVFARRLEYEDDMGKIDADPSAYVELGVTAVF